MTEQLTLPLFIFSQVFFIFPGSFPATYKPTKISFILKTKSFEFMFPFQAIAWFLFSFSTQHLERGLLCLLSLTPHLSFSPPLTLVSAGGVGGCVSTFLLKVPCQGYQRHQVAKFNSQWTVLISCSIWEVWSLLSLTHSVHLTSSCLFWSILTSTVISP